MARKVLDELNGSPTSGVTRSIPKPGAGECLIQVAAAGVNRPDVIRRLGHYPPPPGASSVPGLEIAGTVSITFSRL